MTSAQVQKPLSGPGCFWQSTRRAARRLINVNASQSHTFRLCLQLTILTYVPHDLSKLGAKVCLYACSREVPMACDLLLMAGSKQAGS
jgi:hypothetical protein